MLLDKSVGLKIQPKNDDFKGENKKEKKKIFIKKYYGADVFFFNLKHDDDEVCYN